MQQAMMAGAALTLSSITKGVLGAPLVADFPVVRIPESQRKFKSKAVEALITKIQKDISNKELAWMFGNCFPNTLDTTVDFNMVDGKPDTYVITGDIDAMWLRDSSAQVWPYLRLVKEDKNLQQLIAGVIHRQAKNILLDPYANAFYKDASKESEWVKSDRTDMKPGIHERKWEIDSLCYPIRLSHGYWKETGDATPFDAQWVEAMQTVIKTFTEQQRFHGKGPYSFQRETAFATDTQPMGGYGYPVKPNGLICSMFRPSDDCTIYAYLIPSNFFAVESLLQLEEMGKAIPALSALVAPAGKLAAQVKQALDEHAKVQHGTLGKIYAFEVNGFGSYNLMDDANIPSLLSMPYLNAVSVDDPTYQATRKFVLSADNPFFFKGTAAEGVGGPHIGLDMIWPMSIVMRGLTSNDDKEIKWCLDTLQKTHAATGFMHESFHKDDPKHFTRSWFAWSNTIFGEFVWKVYRERPHLLKA